MTPERPRKPATILRELAKHGAYISASPRWYEFRDLIAELRRAIATSGKAPGPKP